MQDYIAWLNGQSVAMGTLREVEEKARVIADSEDWRRWEKKTTLKITRGARQYFVKSIELY